MVSSIAAAGAAGASTGAPSVSGLTSGISGSEKMGGASKSPEGSSFGDLVKGIAQETINSSKAADQASIKAVNGNITDLELVQVMNEAEISLQRFKTVYERTKESVDKILNMNI